MARAAACGQLYQFPRCDRIGEIGIYSYSGFGVLRLTRFQLMIGIDPVAASAGVGIGHAGREVAERLDCGNGFHDYKADDKIEQRNAEGVEKCAGSQANGVKHAEENVVHQVNGKRERGTTGTARKNFDALEQFCLKSRKMHAASATSKPALCPWKV